MSSSITDPNMAKPIDLTQCHRYALFLAPLGIGQHGMVIFFVYILAFFTSILMTQMVRDLVPASSKKPAPVLPEAWSRTQTTPSIPTPASPSTPIPVELTTIPDPATPDLEANPPVEGEEPPPYVPATPIPDAPTVTSKPKPKSSAHLFVKSTAYTVINLFSLFLLALISQTILFCVWGPVDDTISSVIYWLLFCGPVLFATFGVSCWAMLFRDLFGPKVAKRWQWAEWDLFLWLFLLLISPLILVAVPMMLLGQGAIWVVERCQGRFCADALEDEEREGVDRDEDLELPDRFIPITDSNGPGDEVGSGSRDEERMGLIVGAEKLDD